jgi:hypothetical protein
MRSKEALSSADPDAEHSGGYVRVSTMDRGHTK